MSFHFFIIVSIQLPVCRNQQIKWSAYKVLFIVTVTFFSFLLSDDHSRVRLQLLDGDPHSDYINANYIDVRLLDIPTMANAPADKSAYEFSASYVGTDCWSDMNDSWTLYKHRVVTGRRFSVSSLFCLTDLDRWRFPMFDRSTSKSGMWAKWCVQKSLSAPRSSIRRYLRLTNFLQSYSAGAM